MLPGGSSEQGPAGSQSEVAEAACPLKTARGLTLYSMDSDVLGKILQAKSDENPRVQQNPTYVAAHAASVWSWLCAETGTTRGLSQNSSCWLSVGSGGRNTGTAVES